MKLQQTLLAQFEPDMARQLIAFGQHLPTIEADIIVFIARKSLCLYDVLLKLGSPPIERCIVSDRVLDMRLDYFSGKRVALVDDTLILGTSLAKAKRQLEGAGAVVSTHVFCSDTYWHCPKIIVPDTTTVELSSERVMTFCTAEVRAMALAPRPYLVDFPLSRPWRVTPNEVESLIANTEWTAMKLSTQLQERNGVAVLTFFPTNTLAAQFEKAFGTSVYKCLDLVKVRMWANRTHDSWFLRIVPIVTLCPLTEETLSYLSDYLLDWVIGEAPAMVRLKHFCDSSRARQRLCQFILSIAIGNQFMVGVQQRIGRQFRWQFDHEETDRHFGPWLHDEMVTVIRNISNRLFTNDGPHQPCPRLPPAPIPEGVKRWTATSIGTDSTRTRLRTRQPRDRNVSLLADFAEVFHHIYDNREIPARNEAHELGARYLDPESRAPNRDRLEKGVPWQLLVDWMAKLFGVAKTPDITNMFSLLLDLCNDVGVAVPVTCVQDGVVYRGYRHGEDVKFSDGELALAYDTAEGFLQTSGDSSIPRLTFEKLLVLLIKVGASQGFLEVLYGASGTDGVCKIGFDLKGARPLLTRGPTHRAERDLWLTDYLISRRVVHEPVKKGGRKGQYVLGKRPQGNYQVSRAPDEAKDLGNILGMLMRHDRGKVPILDDGAITLLATCATPSHTVKALQVELAIFREWFESAGTMFSDVHLHDSKWTADALKSLLRSHGHEALHSAKFKFVGFKSNQCQTIVETAAKSLRTEQPIFRRRWLSYWTPLQQTKLIDEQQKFTPLIDRAGMLIWELATFMSVIEIALRYHQLQRKPSADDRQLASAIKKLREYRAAMSSTGLTEPKRVKRISERFEEIGVLKQTEFSFEAGEIALSKGGKASNAPAVFKPAAAIEYASIGIATLLQQVDSLLDLIDPLVQSFGKKAERVDYTYMLYYDIIDSTATVAVRRGRDVVEHREQCQQLKQYINRWFDRTLGESLASGNPITCINGSKSSTNDCKHIFLGGPRPLSRAEDVIAMLAGTATSFGMLVRIYLVPCNFAGTSAYQQGFDPEVKGERFWEHWSRVAKKCAAFEPKPPATGHFLLVATAELVDSFRLGDRLVWKDLKDAEVVSEIEFLNRQTVVRYGDLQNVDPGK
jgi:hypothetical protein